MANHYELVPIDPMGVELGIWRGWYGNLELPWFRWWDAQGNLLLTGDERARIAQDRAQQAEEQAKIEQHRAQQAEERVEQVALELGQERQRAERLAALLRAEGINPEEL